MKIHCHTAYHVQSTYHADEHAASAGHSLASRSMHPLVGRKLPSRSSALLDSDMLLAMMTGRCTRRTPRLKHDALGLGAAGSRGD